MSRRTAAVPVADDAPEALATRLVDALHQVEAAILACPAGHRRRAAVELVVGRVRRLNQRRSVAAPAPPCQLDLEDLLRKP
jgi:hypothetical protein